MKQRGTGLPKVLLALLLAFILTVASGVFALAESGTSEGHNNEGDGNKIESIHIHWVTEDTVDDQEPNNLYLRTRSDTELTMQYQIDVSFSGQYDYEPGSIRITIPPQIWHMRQPGNEDGESLDAGYGGLSLSVPDASSTKTDWHYEINEDGTYSIVNTKNIAATSKAMFQLTVHGIIPHNIVDEDDSDDLNARCEVVTHEGNTIWLDSNTITAKIDTEETLSHAYKNSVFYEDAESVPASLLANLPEGADPKKYVYVRWRTYPQYSGNQNFSLDVEDRGSVQVDGAYDPAADLAQHIGCYKVIYDEEGREVDLVWTAPAVMLGAENGGTTVDNVWTKDVLTNTWNNQGTQPYNNVCNLWTAYSTEDMEWDTTYRMLNRATWTLTEQDPEAEYPEKLEKPKPDQKEVTIAEAKDSTTYTRAKWQYPPGRFMVFKYTEQSETHKHSTMSADSRRSGNYHQKNYTYEMALNRLRKGIDVEMQYEVLTVGYGYIFTCGPLANVVGWEDINGNEHTAPLDEGIGGGYDDNWDSAAWAEDPEHYLNWYYVMDTTDRWNWFQDVSGTPESQLIKANSDDYEFKGVTIASPEMFDWDKSKNPTYYFNTTTFGFIPDESIPKPAVELWVELNNDAAPESGYAVDKDGWVYVGSYTVESGKTQYIDFAALGFEGVTGYRTRIASNQAATKLAVYPHILLKASDRVKDIVENLFAESETPSTTYRNDDMMYVDLYHHAERTEVGEDKDVHPNQAIFLPEENYTHLYIWQDNSRATLTGAGYGAVPHKFVDFDRFTDNDVENRQVVLHYSAYADEMTNLTSVANWREAVQLGAVKEETSGVWYDLLPEGVVPLMDTVSLRPGDTLKSKRTIDNYEGTGRILLIVEADLKAVPAKQNIHGSYNSYVSDCPRLSFDATYTWTDINTLGSHLVNYVAFESGDDERLGTLSGRIGEADAMVRQNNNYTPNREPQDIVTAMTNLDPNSDEERFLYAKADVNLTVDQMAETEYVKSVKNDLDGIWTQGLDGQQQVNVYEGQYYTYRLRVASAKDTVTSNMVMYDSLENYLIPDGGGAEQDATKQKDHDEVESKKDWDGDWDRKTVSVGAEGYEQEIEVGGQWRGRLLSIDVSEFMAKGCAPVIYYATQPWLQFGDTTGSVVDESIFFNYEGRYDVSDGGTWQRVTPGADGLWTVPDGVDVTAIALDLRKRTDGGDFELKSQESGAAYLHMVAPDDHGDENAWHAKGAYAHVNADGSADSFEDIDWDAALNPVNNMHAYNNTRLICQVTYEDGGAFSFITMIRNDYTKVGIMPQIINVEKVWQDDDNHDAKRPESVTVTMKRKVAGAAGDFQVVYDEEAGKPVTVTLDEEHNWKGIFFQADVVDEHGDPYQYTFEEEEIEGYTGVVKKLDDTHFTLINTHENEKTEVSGEKQWLMPDGSNLSDEAKALIPASVKVDLYRTGSSGEKELVTTQTVKPNDDGDWNYLFSGLDKYERGGFEYVYSVSEQPVDYFWSSTQDASDMPDGYTVPFEYDPDAIDIIYNFYIPFGDLSVTKKIEHATTVSENQLFTYNLSLLVKDPELGQVPADGKFEYTIYDVTGEDADETLTAVSTGEIGHGDTFELKGNQRIIIKKIPTNAVYTITEDAVTGWTLTSKVNDSGTVPTAQEIAAEFTNLYSASGNVNVKVNKKLTGHTMIRNKFKFDLVDDNPDSATYGDSIRSGYSPAVTGERDPVDNSLEVIGEIAFPALTYTEADAGKEFFYTVREQIPAEATDNGNGTYTYKGYTYTKKDYPVKVEVIDNGDGTLKVTPYYQDGSEWKPGSEFTYELVNTYEAKGELSFQAWKELEVYDLKEGQFEFELYKYDTKTGDKVGEPIETVSNDAEGIAHFSALTFNQNNVSDDPEHPTEFVYLIREKRGNDPTVVYSQKEYIIHVHPFDNNDGTISFAQDNQTAEREWIETVCPECNGTGVIETRQVTQYLHPTTGRIRPITDTMKAALCTECKGIGTVNGALCDNCKGTGWPIGASFRLDSERETVTVRKHAYLDAQQRYGAFYSNYPTNWTNSGHVVTIATHNTVKCPACDGKGITLTEGAMTITGETGGPVFTNGYRDGNLSVTKLIKNGDPSQTFNFHIQLTGPNLEDKTITYELSQVDSGTEIINGPAKLAARPKAVPLLGAESGSSGPYYATPEELEGVGYAVLNITTGEMVFFRSTASNPVDPYGNTFTISGNRSVEGNLRYYRNFDTFKPSSASGVPWWTSDREYIKKVRMVGAIRPVSVGYWFVYADNLESVDLSKLDTSKATYFWSFFNRNGKLKELDLSMISTEKVTDFNYMFGQMTSLETLNIANFGDFTAEGVFVGSKPGASNTTTKISTITIGDNTKFRNVSQIIFTPPTTDPYDGKWHNIDTGEALTTQELFTEGGHGGTWSWEDPAKYQINFNHGEGATGTMPSALEVLCRSDYTFTPAFYRFGYEVVSMKDDDGNVFTANEDGTITIPGRTYTKDQVVNLTAQWAPKDTSTVMQNGRIDITLHGGEMATFKDIPAGTAYEVWEDTPKGWILVSKVDDAGRIVPLETADAVFTNEYAPNKVSASLTASKWFDDELSKKEFTFQLFEKKNEEWELIQEKENNEGGVASFGIIIYNVLEDGVVGDHFYMIKEIVGNDPTIKYDEHVEFVKITVTDDGQGNAGIQIKYTDENENTSNGVYKNYTQPGFLTIAKSISGSTAASENQEFTFKVTFTDKMNRPPEFKLFGETLTALKAEKTNKTGSTEEISLQIEDSAVTATLKGDEQIKITVPANLKYQVEELDMPDGWTLTDKTGDSGNIVSTETSSSTFTNTYAASGYAALKAEKQVEGEIPEGFAYTFHLYEADENGEQKGEALQTKTNNPLDTAEKITVDETEVDNPDYNKSMVLFDQIKYTEEGTYRYVIVEDTEVQDETIITDARKILATVEVTDKEGQGKLVTEVTYTGGENNSNIFLNKREDGSLKISKTILGATEVSEGTEFTVTLQLTDKNDKPVEGTFAAVRTNGDGEETEETVTVTEGRTEIGIKGAENVLIRGLPHGSAYEAEEEGVDGWTNTDASGESGTIIGKETSEVSFENTYDAKGELTLEVQKKMDPADLETPEGAFSFILMEGRSEVERAQNDAKGHAAFHPIQYSLEDVGKTFTYTIQEQTSTNYATPVSYAFDSTQYTVTVTVKDNGDGTLDATPVFTKNGETVDEIVFANSTRVDIPIRKVWTEDADVVGDVRPARVLVQLLADGEVVATRAISTGNATAEDSNIWESKFTGMPEYKDGKKIVYTVQEVAPANYSASIDNGDETLVITNIYLEAPVTVSGKKVLKGEPVTEGAYSFKLEAPYGGAPMPENDVVSCDAEGKFSFGEMVFRLEDLDQDDEGNLINDTVLTYKVREVIPEEAVLNEEGTVYVLDGVNYDAHVYEVNVTLHYDESANTFTAAKDKEADDILFTNWKDQISLKVIKEWKGAEGGKVELTLYRVQEGEYIRVTDAPEFKFIEEESAYVCEPLPCLDENNEEIIYAVKETGMEGYLTTYVNTGAHASDTDAAFNGATIINTFVTEGSYQPEAKKELSGRALKKNEFSFILTAVDKNGAALTGEDAYSETVSNDADGKVKFTEIRYQMADMDQANGRLEDTRKYYRVKEVVPEDEYKEAGMIYSAKESTITVTLHLNEEGKIEATPDKTISDLVFNNTYVTEKPKTTRLSVIKNWSDNNDQDGKRGSVGATVQLYRKVGDGEAAAVGAAVQVGTENGWSKTWSELPVYENGTAIKYYVVETLPENSEYTKSGDGESTGITASEKENLGSITITNSYEAEKPKTTQLSVTKLWADNNDQDGKRGSVGATVQLYRKVGDGEAAAVGAAEQVGTADGWSKTWSELPVYENGTAIKYYVVETLPENSEYTKSGDGEGTGITASEIDDLGAITITNSYESKQTKITVTKLWEDNNDQDGKRGSVGATVQLYKNLEGEATEQKPVAVGAPVKVGTEDRWSYTWEKLPLYENGRKISYSVKELLPENSEYTSDAGDAPAEVTESEDGLIVEITNSYKPEVTEIPVTKVWNDNNDEDQVRPASITVSLLANGEVVAEQRITAKDGWAYTFEELPVYADGKKITYTVREKPVADYDMPVITGSAEKGFEIKNTHESKPKPTPVPYYFKFTFTKIWQGEHGDSIDWVLYKPDGTVAHKKFDKKVISENEWYYEAWFATDADYYILENVPEGYKVRYENVGAHAGETDRCYNGGTIVNYKVPRTGDSANLWLWAVMALAGAGAVCGVVVYSKKKKDKR